MELESWKKHLPALTAVAAALAALLACLPPVATPFFLVDDPIYVRNNTALQQLPLAEGWRVFTTRTNPWEYLPLRDLSYRVDMALFGLHATGYRVHNLVLYGLSCWAVWLCSVRIIGSLRRGAPAAEARWMAALVTALFAFHPAHVESVVWVSGRKDLLSGLFALLSLWLFARSLDGGAKRGRHLAGSYLAFACAILSKSTVVPLPLVAFLLAVCAAEAPRCAWPNLRRAAALTAPLFLLTLVSVGLQVSAGAAATGAESVDITGAARDWGTRLLLALKILGSLAGIALCPSSLSLVYDVEAPGLPAAAGVALGLVAALAAATGVVLAVRRRSLAGLGLGVAGILATPFLQLIPFSTWSYASERFLYLPVFGIALAAAALLWKLPVRFRLPGALALAALLAAGMLARSLDWRDGRGLIAQAGLRAPTHPIAGRLALHHVYMADDRFEEARAAVRKIRVPSERDVLLDYIDAKEAMKKGDKARLRPLVPKLAPYTPREDAVARREVANMAQEAGLYALAEQSYRGLLRDYPDSSEVHYNLGLALAKQGRHAEAAKEMRLALDGGHVTARVWNNLALAYRDSGQPDRAAEAFRSALKADPAYWHPAYNLARLLWAGDDRDGARAALQTARERAARSGDSTAPLDELERAMRP